MEKTRQIRNKQIEKILTTISNYSYNNSSLQSNFSICENLLLEDPEFIKKADGFITKSINENENAILYNMISKNSPFDENDCVISLFCLKKTPSEHPIYALAKNKIKKHFLTKNIKESLFETLFATIMYGRRSPLCYENIDTEKELLFTLKFSPIYSSTNRTFINSLSNYIYEKINANHLFNIKERLCFLKIPSEEIDEIIITMYLTLGYDKSMQFAEQKYGPLSNQKMKTIFTNHNLSKTNFCLNGKGFIPVLNEKYIDIYFGKNYKSKNSPIFFFLNALPNFSARNICTMMPYVFENWFFISKHFIELKAYSHLETKLNCNTLEKIVAIIRKNENQKNLILDDEALKISNYDDSFVNEELKHKVQDRILELKSEQNGLNSKYFPYVITKNEKLSISVLAPDDPHIFSLGYENKSCFRANANADNFGASNSLLRYCSTTKYGGAIIITNQEGENIAFSPIMRNGNLLMVHSLESSHLVHEDKIEIQKLLKKWALEVIATSHHYEKNPIDVITITDLNGLVLEHTQGKLNCPVQIYNDKFQYDGVYNNLQNDQYILGKTSNFTEQSLRFRSPIHEYHYDKTYSKTEYLSSENIKISNKILSINSQIDLLEKNIHMNLDDVKESLLTKLSSLENIYLSLYVQYFASYNKYIKQKRITEQISGCKKVIPYNQVLYGQDWYIGLLENNYEMFGCIDQNELEWMTALQYENMIPQQKII